MRTEVSAIGASTRNRVLVIIGVIALSLWMIYPIHSALKLGLDLNGGDGLRIRRVVLLALDERFDVGWGDQAHLIPESR